ncbi:MAG: Lrp/AsnC family transcriptional regulator [Muribaculaceae bacterium]|nr:Lrp/AsnC family transcriptional regulator [Muribaculaceae bacterium]
MKTISKTIYATIAQLVHGNNVRAYIINLILAHNGRISIAGIAKLMFRSREAIAKHIRVLEAMRVIRHIGTKRNGYWQVIPLNQAQLNQRMGIPPQLAQQFNRVRLKSRPTKVHKNATKVHNETPKIARKYTEIPRKYTINSTEVHNPNPDDFFTVSYGY